jgi:hypothetical protein
MDKYNRKYGHVYEDGHADIYKDKHNRKYGHVYEDGHGHIYKDKHNRKYGHVYKDGHADIYLYGHSKPDFYPHQDRHADVYAYFECYCLGVSFKHSYQNTDKLSIQHANFFCHADFHIRVYPELYADRDIYAEFYIYGNKDSIFHLYRYAIENKHDD